MRPGIVHRLDKDTSGVMVVAKSDEAALSLVRQFSERKVKKVYNGLVWGAAPDKASAYFDRLVEICRQKHTPVETGAFGADMQVSLTNDGPVTFWLST